MKTRGIKKTEAHLAAWLKDLAPSDDLRRWFDHNPVRHLGPPPETQNRVQPGDPHLHAAPADGTGIYPERPGGAVRPLDKVVATIKEGFAKLAAKDDSIGPPYHYLTVTDRGVQKVG